MTEAKGRGISKVITAKMMSEGQGAKVRRSVGTRQLDSVDPFLMLDEFYVKAPAGFPDHPHRGFETVTYMLDGKFTHKDNKGHEGTISVGDVQWMTAGRGIVHSEMPGTPEVNHGLQLWVNLPKAQKMKDPNYQELTKEQIPNYNKDGVTVRIIAGESYGIKAKVYTHIPITYLHVTLEKSATFEQAVPSNLDGFVYVLKGEGQFGKDSVAGKEGQLLMFDAGESLSVQTKEGVDFVLLSGKPIKEPVAKYGPFVMNTQEEIMQAMVDYRNGLF
eukprot:CAMPEP_0168512510 /NCGR_PEP_ID=MMETSP0405-20121227/2832_1 /TAXON_ID=498012 /ORGANISM="Trichosphaerium sp, Strain Am-I-7 wt" /LENGTH=273 /DNA_ID=CAMNT_0008531009 /DNA_START=103 /DNA_END=924 /DNA_ORIENTATION=-